mmetsp:Transcript_14592/g.35489  ORF Transcript_14592/g.35489 Transcript_14592/m.35489 type:complete len:547 (-) Transcript_14592:75-1715(-)
MRLLQRRRRFVVQLVIAAITMDVVSPLSSTSSPPIRSKLPQFIGIDLGTSGARLSIVEEPTNDKSSSSSPDGEYDEVFSQAITWNSDDCGSYDDAEAWVRAVEILLDRAADSVDGGLKRVSRICVSGTSASCLVVDRQTLEVTRSPRMYNYDICSNAKGSPAATDAAEQATKILEKCVPSKHTARARTGSLAKLLAWQCEDPLQSHEVLCHQSDFVSARLIKDASESVPRKQQQNVITSDWHNCLKLGYDVRDDEWPSWMKTCLEDAGISDPYDEQTNVIPLRIISPGETMGTISPIVAKRFGLPVDTMLVGGTTDSNAAFFAAAGAQPQIGTAVTSLGSTLAIKLLSEQYVEDADRGVYSHRFPSFSSSTDSDPELQQQKSQWLVGGASNVGCAIFRELEFSNDELDVLSEGIDPDIDSPLSYYPLLKPGERFPTADSNKAPVVEPVPDNRQEYLHGLLQSITHVERDGFIALRELGSPTPSIVWTCGGGSRNDVWTRMRQRILNGWVQQVDVDNAKRSPLKVMRATNTEASFGAGLLAAASYRD